jgi:dTDP-4-dehydrorhamnose reductase
MPKILITGANGQLGSEFKALAPAHPAWDFTLTDIEELDITDLKAVMKFVSGGKFDSLINCAGYTAVDRAEEEPEKALLLNSTAVGNLVFAAMNAGCFPVHISTDYVFSGNHNLPYTEDDLPDPDSTYGMTKLLGEENFLDLASRGIIIRTSWLYSAYGSNFVKTILRVSREKGELRVVDDQVGCPTWANDLARHILEILPAAMKMPRPEIFHYSNDGECSWYRLAEEAIKLSGINCKVARIRTADYPTLAKRPAYSVLDKTKIVQTFGLSLPYWKGSLKHCIGSIELRA